MENILFVDGGGWNGVTTVQVNVINYFLEKGHFLEIILFDNGIPADPIKYDRWPRNARITYHVINQKSYLDKVFNRIAFFKHAIKFIKCFSILKRYRWYYAFEFEAGILLSFYKWLSPSKNYFLHSIELHKDTSSSSFVRKAFKSASVVLTQDKIRKVQLQKLYNIEESRIMISVNSSRSSDKIDTTPLDFPEHVRKKKKILFIGSLIDEHCFPDVLSATESIPDDYCLIIHGWGGKKYAKILEQLMKIKPYNVWVSDFQLDDVTKFRLYASIDIGLVTFNASYYNCRYAGLSAGKLFDFIRVGKPVIASDIIGLEEFVFDNKIGFCVNDFSRLYSTAETIFERYDFYSQNSRKLFPTCEFDQNFSLVYEKFVSSSIE